MQVKKFVIRSFVCAGDHFASIGRAQSDSGPGEFMP
jgi:hypothetical protein